MECGGSSRRGKPKTLSLHNYGNKYPLSFVDPDGMFGDYYGADGKWLGTDHKDDDKAYVAKDGSYTKQGNGYAIKKSGIKELSIGNKELVEKGSDGLWRKFSFQDQGYDR